MSKGLWIGLTAALAAILVVAAQNGLIPVNGEGQAALTGAVGALFVIARVIVKRVTAAGIGWKTISAGVALLVASGAEALGFTLPGFVVTLLTMWGAYGLGDVSGLLKPAPK